MTNEPDSIKSAAATFAEQDAAGAERFRKQWETKTPGEIVDENEQERQRLLQEVIAERANIVTTRGSDTRHMRTVRRATGKPAGEN
jgi:hypothetical protein